MGFEPAIFRSYNIYYYSTTACIGGAVLLDHHKGHRPYIKQGCCLCRVRPERNWIQYCWVAREVEKMNKCYSSVQPFDRINALSSGSVLDTGNQRPQSGLSVCDGANARKAAHHCNGVEGRKAVHNSF